MALFTDGTISTLEDLRAYESAIYDLATTERIDLTRKLALGRQELEMELVTRLFRDDPEELKKVVVTPALQLWHTFHTIALTYRDAYNSHLNDRYQGKWREYERLARWASENTLTAGVGMVAEPVPKAAAPILGTAPGNVASAMYWVRAAWVSQSGEEGCASEPSVLSAPDDTVPVASVADAPADVSGWNVYVGTTGEVESLQNPSPIPIDSSWTMPGTGLVAGRAAGTGQAPTSYRRFERVFRRG